MSNVTANEASDALKKFSAALKTSANTLEKLNKFTKVSKGLLQMSAGLGALGGAIAFINVLSGAESDTDKIIGEIKKVSEKIDRLGKELSKKIDQKIDKKEFNDGIKDFEENSSVLETWTNKLRDYAIALESKDKDSINLEKRNLLASYPTKDIVETSARNLQDLVNDKGYDLFEGIFKHEDTDENLMPGDVQEICNWMSSLLRQITQAYLIDSTITALHIDEAYPDNPEERSKQFKIKREKLDITYNAFLKTVQEKGEIWIKKCGDDRTIYSLVEGSDSFLPAFVEKKGIKKLGHEDYAKKLRDNLSAHWPQLDWLVISYDMVSESDDHSWKGSRRWSNYDNHQDFANIGWQRYLHVSWIPKDELIDGSAYGSTTVPIRVTMHTHKLEKYLAEDIGSWQSVETVLTYLETKVPEGNPLTFMLKKGYNFYMKSTNTSRLKIHKGSAWSLIFWGAYEGDNYLQHDIRLDRIDEGYPRQVKNLFPSFKACGFDFGISAAFKHDNGKTYIFKNEKYIKYDFNTGKIDSGYPRKISGAWGNLPFTSITAAVNLGNGLVWFFKGENYCIYNISKNKATPISNIHSLGITDASMFKSARIDAAVKGENDKVFLFSGDRYWAFKNQILLSGYPLSIRGYWPGFSKNFEKGLSAAFNPNDDKIFFIR